MESQLTIDLSKSKDIFEKYNNELKQGKTLEGKNFETDLKNRYECNYQTVKMIILKSFDQKKYTNICYHYAVFDNTRELKRIIKEYETR